MNRCLRSLSCLLAVTALALGATNATARTNPKQQHAGKAPEKKAHEKKPHAAKEARPHRNAAEKRRHVKHAHAKKKSKQAKDAPPPKEAAAPLTGDLARSRRRSISRARARPTTRPTRTGITDPAGAKARRMVFPAPSGTTARFALCAYLANNPEWPSARCCADGRRRGCGRRVSDATSPRSSREGSVDRQGRSALARVNSPRATASPLARGGGEPGDRRNWRGAEEQAYSKRSATFWPAMTIARA